MLIEEDIKPLPVSTKMVGLDLGIKSMVIESNGHTHVNPRFGASDEKKLAKAQGRLAKKKKGSQNRAKARLKVAHLHAKIADRRLDYQHQLSARIVNENQVICVESLNVKGMVKNHPLAKAISDREKEKPCGFSPGEMSLRQIIRSMRHVQHLVNIIAGGDQ